MKNLSVNPKPTTLPFPVRTVVPTMSNGLRLSDISNYKDISEPNKRKARNKAIKTVRNLRLGRVETSILPNYLILEIWKSETSIQHKLRFNLIIDKSFDGGSNFRIENKFQYSSEKDLLSPPR
jgi:hypothetical protein